MTPFEARAILEKIKANRAKLDACPKHRFDAPEPPYPPYPLGTKFVCTNCGGTLDAVQALAYAQGFKAAGGDPSEVIPGF